MKRAFLGFLLVGTFLTWASLAEAQGDVVSETPVLTFPACYEKILEHYPALKRQQAKSDAAAAAKSEAVAGLFPSISGESSVMTSDDPVTVFGSLLRQEAFTQNNFALSSLNSPRHRTNFNFSLEGVLPLFNAFQTISRIRSSNLIVKSEDDRKAFVEMEASLLATEAYLKLLLARRLFALTRQVEEMFQEDLKQAEDLKNRGMVLGADFYAAKVVHSAVTQIRHRFDTSQQAARIILNILMGENPDLDYPVAGDLPRRLQENKTFQEWLEQAYESRRDLKSLEAVLKARRIEVFREKSSFLPRVHAFGSVEEDTRDFVQGGENFMMGIKGAMPFWDPSYLGRIKKAKAQIQEAEAGYAQLQDEIAQQVAEESLRFDNIRNDFAVVQKSCQDSEEAVKLTAILYREGRKSIADLSEIRKAHLETVLRREELSFQMEYQYAKLFFLTGRLDSDAVRRIAERIGDAA